MKILEKGLAIARKRRDSYDEASFLTSLGNCYLYDHHYRKAIEVYSAGSEIAVRNRYADLAVTLASNRATIYRALGDHKAALDALRSVQHLVGDRPQPFILFQIARLVGAAGDKQRAVNIFLSGIDSAASAGAPKVEATGWNLLGFLHLDSGNLAEADVCLTRAFRLRKMFAKEDLPSSYVHLGVLRLIQGDAVSANNLFDRVSQTGLGRTQIAAPFVLYRRAEAKAAVGHFEAALAEYRRAIRLSREWRIEVLPADSFRISAESTLQKIYSSYISTGMKYYAATNKPEIAAAMLNAAEENRAVSMRQELRLSRAYPPEYWELLGTLRSLTAKSLETAIPEDERQISQLRLKLTEIELGLGLDRQDWSTTEGSQSLLKSIQARLLPSQVLLSFHWDPSTSFVWAVTKDGLGVAQIGSAEIQSVLTTYRDAVRTGDTKGIRTLGTRLFQDLLGGVSAQIQEKPEWLLSLDGPLWEVPFSALPDASSPQSGYVIARHAIRIVPGAGLLQLPPSNVSMDAPFVGIADAIYNRADPRFKRMAKTFKSGPEFPRLPGSRKEVLDGAKAWGTGQPTLLLGDGIERASVQHAVADGPAALHFAAHVVQRSSNQGEVMVALGLRPSGTPEFLSPADVASWRHSIGLVVLSGCGSGQGAAIPGAGLVGLTRAWLLSGAQAVVATYWPIPDDASPFFKVFYRELRSRGGPYVTAAHAAEALRHAQSAMLASGNWQANPGYWSSFFVVGRD